MRKQRLTDIQHWANGNQNECHDPTVSEIRELAAITEAARLYVTERDYSFFELEKTVQEAGLTSRKADVD